MIIASTFPNTRTPSDGVRNRVISTFDFKKHWNSKTFTSFGDWQSLLAITTLAKQLGGGDYATANSAMAGGDVAHGVLFSTELTGLAAVISLGKNFGLSRFL